MGVCFMKNNKGFVEATILYFVVAGLFLLFVPNPISSSVGLGIKPNKTVQTTTHTEKLVPVASIMVDGKEVPQYKVVADDKTSDQDIQQHVGFWEWLRSLPVLVLLLMGAGIVFPGISLWLHSAWTTLKTDTQKIVLSVDKGLSLLKAKNPTLHAEVLSEIGDVQAAPSSTETVVNKAQTGTLK